MMNGKQSYGESQSHFRSPLAQSRQGDFGSAAKGPVWYKVVLGEPRVLKSHFFGVGYFLHCLPESTVFILWSSGFRSLQQVEHSELHWYIPSWLLTGIPDSNRPLPNGRLCRLIADSLWGPLLNVKQLTSHPPKITEHWLVNLQTAK